MKRMSEMEQKELERQYKLIQSNLEKINVLMDKYGDRSDVISFYIALTCKDLDKNDLKLVVDAAYQEHRLNEFFLLAIDQLSNPNFPDTEAFKSLFHNPSINKSIDNLDNIVLVFDEFIKLGKIRRNEQIRDAKNIIDFLTTTKLPDLSIAIEIAKNFDNMTKYEIRQRFKILANLANNTDNKESLVKLETFVDILMAGKLQVGYLQQTIQRLKKIVNESVKDAENSAIIRQKAVEKFSQIISQNKAESLICLEILLATIKYNLTSREMANILTKTAHNFSNQTENYQKFQTVIKLLMMDPASERGKSFATKAAALYAKSDKPASAEEITKALRVFLEARTMINAISPPEPTRPVSNSVSPPNTDPSAAHKRRKKNG